MAEGYTLQRSQSDSVTLYSIQQATKITIIRFVCTSFHSDKGVERPKSDFTARASP